MICLISQKFSKYLAQGNITFSWQKTNFQPTWHHLCCARPPRQVYLLLSPDMSFLQEGEPDAGIGFFLTQRLQFRFSSVSSKATCSATAHRTFLNRLGVKKQFPGGKACTQYCLLHKPATVFYMGHKSESRQNLITGETIFFQEGHTKKI